MKETFVLVTALLSLAATASSQEAYRPVLIPIAQPEILGEGGARWTTELWVTVAAPRTQLSNFIPSPFCMAFLCNPGDPIEGGARYFARNYLGTDRRGFVVWVGGPGNAYDQTFFYIRLINDHAAARTLGVQVPTVRDYDLRQLISLMNVPLDPGFRETLRVYAISDDPEPRVRITILDMTNDRGSVLAEVEMSLSAPPRVPVAGGGSSLRYLPNYLELNRLAEIFPQLLGQRSVQIDVESLTPDAKIWAMVSLTHNITNDITIISPE